MRRLSVALIAAVSTVAFTQIASAADLPVKAPAYNAPVATAYNWTGCYIGAHIGYGWNHVRNTDDLSTDWPLGQAVDIDGNGFLGGGQIGCDYQLRSNFVIGIEGDLSAADISGSTLVTSGLGAPAPTGSTLTVNTHAKTDWLGTVTGRLGYSFDSTLLYVKGGVAFAHDKYGGDWSANIIGFGTLAGSVSATDTRTGWIIGGGLEHAFTKNWSAKIEYNYMDFGTHAVSFPVAIPSPGPSGTFYIGDISQTIQTVTAGINYRF
jgi:outer membrane immunogenic protein